MGPACSQDKPLRIMVIPHSMKHILNTTTTPRGWATSVFSSRVLLLWGADRGDPGRSSSLNWRVVCKHLEGADVNM